MLFIYACRLLEKDKRALTRISSTNSTVSNSTVNEAEQKNVEQKTTELAEQKSFTSSVDISEFTSDSPALPRRPSVEEMWYVTLLKHCQFISFTCNK